MNYQLRNVVCFEEGHLIAVEGHQPMTEKPFHKDGKYGRHQTQENRQNIYHRPLTRTDSSCYCDAISRKLYSFQDEKAALVRDIKLQEESILLEDILLRSFESACLKI